ncbi:hypothetical protein BC940DRAFT_315468 [Gongronella butleri]|nr:hypothetical protein BC940DRAFT_315468 [Gongronella butleri]
MSISPTSANTADSFSSYNSHRSSTTSYMSTARASEDIYPCTEVSDTDSDKDLVIHSLNESLSIHKEILEKIHMEKEDSITRLKQQRQVEMLEIEQTRQLLEEQMDRYNKLDAAYHVLLKDLDAKKRDYDKMETKFYSHVKTIRATDDDLSTIQQELGHMASQLNNLCMGLKSRMDVDAASAYLFDYFHDQQAKMLLHMNTLPDGAPIVEKETPLAASVRALAMAAAEDDDERDVDGKKDKNEQQDEDDDAFPRSAPIESAPEVRSSSSSSSSRSRSSRSSKSSNGSHDEKEEEKQEKEENDAQTKKECVKESPQRIRLAARHITMLTEKLVMDHLLATIFDQPLYIGMDVNASYGEVMQWMKKYNASWADRFRQQMSSLVANQAVYDHQAAIEQAKTRVIEQLIEQLGHLYPVLQQLDHKDTLTQRKKIETIVTRAARLSLAMQGQDIPVQHPTIAPNSPFDPALMKPAGKGQTDGNVLFVISPPFIATDPNDQEHGFLLHAKVYCP